MVQTLSGHMGTGGGNTPMVLEAFAMQGFGDYKESDVLSGCKARDYKDATDLIVAIRDDVTPKVDEEGKAFTLDARDYKGPQAVLVPDVAHTLKAKANCDFREDSETYVVVDAQQRYIVRRLTPMECERLQGYPDRWTDIGAWTGTDGKAHKESADGARYKALGNSIALPPWMYVLQRLSLSCGPDHTMASLFDGIGGFPLIWEFYHGKGSCLWASEIEEFPMAVTRRQFNQEGGE